MGSAESGARAFRKLQLNVEFGKELWDDFVKFILDARILRTGIDIESWGCVDDRVGESIKGWCRSDISS